VIIQTINKGGYETKPLQRRIDLTITYAPLQWFCLRPALSLKRTSKAARHVLNRFNSIVQTPPIEPWPIPHQNKADRHPITTPLLRIYQTSRHERLMAHLQSLRHSKMKQIRGNRIARHQHLRHHLPKPRICFGEQR
jgi:hypothetical protein